MTNAEWAIRIWPVLVDRAKKRKPITYSELAAAVGYGHYRMSRQLEPIYRFCGSHQGNRRVPHLTILVVETRTRKPSPGAFAEFTPAQADRELERVYAYDWDSLPVPPPETFQELMKRP